ncbi:60S ribosomal protein L28, putative [Plasmodium ovale wallikeri]|uniref:60S ribosomal protein L28, putative n=2 Tax=Plasmodium ovale TaxID=36330 RepID=A0A1A8YWY2_PLAOA|nr:60S ribosomal protein L28, putative [Plasmodium ovale wallikeri]SBT36216.1 60S ribosomal protein L28, putative [Plasmodium ovale wallikeri]SBT77302.1 60S ribosomal protein L28, putative [Plasmodium ovale]
MVNMSAPLLWELTKNNNCFLMKNPSGRKEKFLCNPYNINCKNTLSSSGLIKDNAINFRFINGKVVLCVKTIKDGVVVNKKYRTKNKENAKKLIMEHGKNETPYNLERLMKKYNRLSKLYDVPQKSNK